MIRTEGLTKRYGRVTALEGLSVDLEPGITGLVGANGAGKSTLLKILLGLLPATEGSAHVLDLDVRTDGPAIRERVGYMPEHDCLPPDVTATEFCVHMARMSGLPTTAARERNRVHPVSAPTANATLVAAQFVADRPRTGVTVTTVTRTQARANPAAGTHAAALTATNTGIRDRATTASCHPDRPKKCPIRARE